MKTERYRAQVWRTFDVASTFRRSYRDRPNAKFLYRRRCVISDRARSVVDNPIAAARCRETATCTECRRRGVWIPQQVSRLPAIVQGLFSCMLNGDVLKQRDNTLNCVLCVNCFLVWLGAYRAIVSWLSRWVFSWLIGWFIHHGLTRSLVH